MRAVLWRARHQTFDHLVRRATVLALVAGLLATVTALGLIAPAQAAGTPDVQVSGGPAGTVLYGRTVPVSVTAALPAGAVKGYNLAFRAVLPAGTSYVAGSAGPDDGEPRVLADAPTSGSTTLIWPNVDDLVANASHTLSFDVDYQDTSSASGPRYDVGDSIAIASGAYIATDPRDEADFDAHGVPSPTGSDTYTGWAEQSSAARLTAIQVRKSEPHPEGEIPRGVHDHQTVYTLTITNNEVNPTSGVVAQDWLPAGLELLGCAATPDHTTDAPTNPGSAAEYPGSGPIVVTHPTAAEGCLEPDVVETVSTDPDGSGPLPSGVYTHVVWQHVGDFAASQVRVLRYAAAIPVRENTLTWSGTTPGTSGAQTANLDNNSGPETYDEQPLLNGAMVDGTYEAPAKPGKAVSDEGTLLRTAEDIAVQKSNDLGTLEQGDLTRWTIDLQVSEYRTVTDVVVHDVLPDGLCPLGTTNLAHDPDAQDAECDPVTGKVPSAPYTTVAEQGNGTYDLTWDRTTMPSLATIAPSGTRQITFWTRTRADYQEGFADATPVLSRDSVANDVDVQGLDWIRLAGGAPIDHDEADGDLDYDQSQSGKAADGPTILKQVGAHFPGTGQCGDLAAADYGKTVPAYGPGDHVCWKLRLDFPARLDTTSQDVFDVLPTGLTYVPGSWAVTPADTVTVGGIDTGEAGRLRWPLGTSGSDVDSGSQVFEVTFESTVGSPLGHASGDVEGNLQKFSYQNTATKAFTLRDRTDFTWTLPRLGLTKSADDTVVEAGQGVHYTVAVTNSGTAAAEDARVWDVLPAHLDCSDVGAMSDGGTCASGRITWTGLDLAAGASHDLAYTLTVPGDVSPGVAYTNHAAVMEYGYVGNTGSTYRLVPANTTVTDPSLPAANAPAAEGAATIRTADATVTKTRTTSVAEAGNSAGQAAIGEVVTYTVTTTVPKGTTVYGATVTDPLGSRQSLVPGSLCVGGCTLDGAPLASVTESPTNTVVATLPATYAAPAATDGVLVLTFQAKVLDVAANSRGTSLGNTATFAYTDQDGAAHTRTGSTSTTVVEPSVTLAKQVAGSSVVGAGEVKAFTITYSNSSAANVSTAHDLVVVDTLPAGTEPVTINDGGVWDAAARTITWDRTKASMTTLAPGASGTLTYTVQVESPPVGGTAYTNTAAVTSTSLDRSTPGVRSSTASAQRALTVALPSVTKDVTPTTATIGSPLTWTVRVEVPAGIRYWDTTVVDTVPDGLTVDGYGPVTCTAGCPGTDPAVSTFPVTASGSAQQAAWFLGDLAPAAQKRTYELVLTGHVLATKRAGGAVTAPVSLTNQARVRSNRTDVLPAAPASVPSSYADTVGPANATTAVREPGLTIDKSADKGPTVKPGEALTYTVTVTNTGGWPAYGVVVADQPDSELTDVVPATGASSVTDGWTAADPDLAWTVPGPLAPGASVTFTYTARVAPAGVVTPGATVHNTATVDSYAGLPTSPTDARTYHGPSDSVDLTVVPYADLAVTKTADRASYVGGDVVTWTITVTNHGLSPAADAVVTDPLPVRTSFVSATPTSGTCSVANGTLTCALGTMASGATRTVVVKTKAAGLPPANTSTDPHVHDLTVSKVEQYLTLAAGESATVDLSCAAHGLMSDGSVEVMHVDQGNDPADVVVERASTLSVNGYRFVVRNTTTGQAQAKLFGTCLPHDTEATEGHVHGLDVGPATTLDTGAMADGRHTFTVPVSAGHHAVAPGIEVTAGQARLVSSETVPGGRRFTVEAVGAARATLSLRELADKTLGAAPSQHQHALDLQLVTSSVVVPAGESVQRIGCPVGYKGIVAGYDLPAGVLLLGHEPQPINRDVRLWNTTGHDVTVDLQLQCLAIRTGPALDESFTLSNTATATSATYDPDLSDNSATATASLTASAGTVSLHPAAAPAQVVALARTLTVAASGKRAAVTLRCGGTTGACSGTLRLVAKLKRPGHRAVRVVLGSRSYTVRHGAQVRVRIAVAKKYRKAVRAGRVHGYRIR